MDRLRIKINGCGLRMAFCSRKLCSYISIVVATEYEIGVVLWPVRRLNDVLRLHRWAEIAASHRAGRSAPSAPI